MLDINSVVSNFIEISTAVSILFILAFSFFSSSIIAIAYENSFVDYYYSLVKSRRNTFMYVNDF